ncbi:MAG: hypothetical protein H7A51_13085 [Akkermansiaceae bacterium]|nr:hypothetical protein [Akkermansiaceae bacterium]
MLRSTVIHTAFIFIALWLTPKTLCAQDEEEQPVRTLRVMIAGTRPLPVFEKSGNVYIEVDPPVSQLPPTSFAFANAAHAPKGKPGVETQTSFSAWPNELVRIKNYKGPATLPLTLRRPLVQKAGANCDVSCELGEALDPLIFIRANPGSAGWSSPVTEVIDMSPARMPANSAVVVNYTKLPLAVYFTKRPLVLRPNSHKSTRLPVVDGPVRYRIDTSVNGKTVTVSNSSYKLQKNSRLIILALPSPAKAKGNPVALRMINDPL